MENLARVCNETFDMRIRESFDPVHFDRVMKSVSSGGMGFFGDFAWAVEAIQMEIRASVQDENFKPLWALREICLQKNVQCHYFAKEMIPFQFSSLKFSSKLEMPGYGNLPK